ncbi:MAG: mandelate racemase/muconate lactonizing enzyme family protein [Fuerstiella sp.]|nr:mandelate racemase/muconate lactonizing enzyme family protein [Fuerstiella sp.]
MNSVVNNVPPFSSDHCSRRSFLAASAGAAAAGGLLPSSSAALRAALKRSESLHGPVTVTDIEVHEITNEFVDWQAWPLNHFYGPWTRTIYVAHTNTGLIGLGESGWTEPPETIEKYIGTSPFDWVGDETSLGLGTAMYDLMGKAAMVPVYKLFGQQYRKWVSVSSWTVSTHPDRMAEAVRRYSKMGYTWMKYHLSPFENVLDQMDAMQAVAPRGFRIHHDFTMHGTDDHMFELLEKISEYPIAGCFEDPLTARDIDGHAELRKRCRLPIVYHHSPLGATFEVQMRAADAYMLGHQKIGTVMRRAGLFAATNTPFMLQNTGGNITRAMVAHMQSAFKTSSFHFGTASEIMKWDVVKERLDPVNGFVRVPETPGLGVTLDREELERIKNLNVPGQDKWIVRTRFENGTAMYNIHDPEDSIFMVRPDTHRLIPMSYDAPVTTDYWDDDGTNEYRNMFARIQREGIVIINE